MVVLIAYRHGYKGLPGSLLPRTLSGKCLSGDLSNPPKVMVLYGFYHSSSANVIKTFALCVMSSACFAAQASCESDFDISIKYVISMCYNISVFARAFSLHRRKARAILHFKEVCVKAIKPQPLKL